VTLINDKRVSLLTLLQSKLLSKSAKNPYAQYSRYVVTPHLRMHARQLTVVSQLVFEMQNQNHSGTHFLPYLRIQKRWYGGSCIFVASSLR